MFSLRLDIFKFIYVAKWRILYKIDRIHAIMQVGNYKNIVGGLIKPHQDSIAQAALHFKNTMQEYKSNSQQRPSVQMPPTYTLPYRSPSLLSDYTIEPEQDGES